MSAQLTPPVPTAVTDRETAVMPSSSPEPRGISTALLLTETLNHLNASSRHLHDLVAAATGLRLGELRVLDAVAAGATDLSDLAARTGELPAAVQATLASLTASELVARATSPEARSRIAITESGRARLDQLEAIHLRLLAEMPAGVAEPLLTFARRAREDVVQAGGSR